ncbi:MAG: OadG family protein [Pseudomonadota bacterium]
MFMLGEIPWGDGLRVFGLGFGGVFVALGLLYGGIRLTTFVAGKLEQKKD